jgi:hypothetical protein
LLADWDIRPPTHQRDFDRLELFFGQAAKAIDGSREGFGGAYH